MAKPSRKGKGSDKGVGRVEPGREGDSRIAPDPFTAVLPALAALGFLGGLYGFYLMYLGLPHVMNTPQEKALKYLAVSILVVIAINWTISMVLTSIVFSVFGLNAMSTMGGA